MRGPRGSGVVRLSAPVRFRVKKLLSELARVGNADTRALVSNLRFELGLLDPKELKRLLLMQELLDAGVRRLRRQRDRESAKRVVGELLPIVRRVKKFFATVEVTEETIGDMLEATDPEWGGTARDARLLAEGLNLYLPFKWDVETVRALVDGRPVVWLEQQLAPRIGVGAATLHNLLYRQ